MEKVLNQITPLLRELLTLSPKGKMAIELYLNETIKNGMCAEETLALEFQFLRQQFLTRLMRLLKNDPKEYEQALLYLHFGMRIDVHTLEEILELSHTEFVQQLYHAIEQMGLDPQLFSYRVPSGPNVNLLMVQSWWPLISSFAGDGKTVELVTQILSKLKFKSATATEVMDLKKYLNEKYFKKLTLVQKVRRAFLPGELQ
ncbi:MAG: hypothetical protein HYV97_19805 [Bdellovibrio sp.]|nr:hypothetical protein [Bdellovibrio sp.]